MYEIIIVDDNDDAIGMALKMEAHRMGLLHRAFSVLLYRYANEQIEVLLQQRASAKYHSAGLWTNTCCSHPRPNETIQQAAHRRLYDEIGVEKIGLKEIGHFHYRAELDHGFIENEIDHVLIGRYDNEKMMLNADEVSNIQWVEMTRLKNDLINNAQCYTAWLPSVLALVEKSGHLRESC